MKAIRVKTFAQLLTGLTDKAIVNKLQRLFEEDFQEKYRGTLFELRHLTPVPGPLICFLRPQECHCGRCTPDVQVSCIRAGNEDELFAIDFEPWPKVLGMPVILDHKLPPMTELEIVAHILCEMTYAGFSENAVLEQRAAVFARLDAMGIDFDLDGAAAKEPMRH